MKKNANKKITSFVILIYIEKLLVVALYAENVAVYSRLRRSTLL